jgi:hypothetical protein
MTMLRVGKEKNSCTCSLVVNVVEVVDGDDSDVAFVSVVSTLLRDVTTGSLLLWMVLGLIQRLSAPFSRNHGGSGLRVVVVVNWGEQA